MNFAKERGPRFLGVFKMFKHPASVDLESRAAALEGERDLATSTLARIEVPAAEPIRQEITFRDEPIAQPEPRVEAAIAGLKLQLREGFDIQIREIRKKRDHLEAMDFELN